MPFNIDLHTHTFFGRRRFESGRLDRQRRGKGLQGIAITDHNTCEAITYLLEKGLMREDGLPVEDFLVLPGVEVTTAEGHLLCVGTTLPDAGRLKGRPGARCVCTDSRTRRTSHPAPPL